MTQAWQTPEIQAALARLEEAEVGLDKAISAAKQVEQQVPKSELSEEDVEQIEKHARSDQAPRQLRELQRRIDEGELSWSDIASGEHLDDPEVRDALSTGVDGMKQAYTLIQEGQDLDDIIEQGGAQPSVEPDERDERDNGDGDGEDDDGPEGAVFRGVY